MFRALLSCWLLFACAAPSCCEPDKWFSKPLSPRVAHYHIQAVLDWPGKRLQGVETLTWRNTGTAPTSVFPVLLYMNSFKKPGLNQALDPNDARAWGYCRLRGASMNGVALQGQYGQDETIWWLRLPKPVLPGDSIQMELQWDLQFPKLQHRTGWAGYFLMGAHWFPQAGVYVGDRWISEPCRSDSDPVSDFGTYDVEMSLPNLITLASTGEVIPQAHPTQPGKLVDALPDAKHPLNSVWKMHAEDVRDFVWTAMPDRSWNYKVMSFRDVRVYLFHPPGHQTSVERQAFAVRVGLRHLEDYGTPYPYPVLTVVDLPEEARAINNASHPTLITITSKPFDPFSQRLVPEGAIIHGIGRQIFQNIVASREPDAWMNDRLASWFTQKAMEQAFPAICASRRFVIGANAPDWHLFRMATGTEADSWKTFVPGAGDALALNQLEALVGRSVMEEILRTHAREMSFKHPSAHDFRRIAERVSRQNLSAFWRNFVEEAGTVDFAIMKVDNHVIPRGGWTETAGDMRFVPPENDAGEPRGSITLVREGTLRVPVTLWVRLANNREQRITWDGQDRWISYNFESPITAAVLDPDGNYPAMKDRLHACWTAKPLRRGLHYWAQLIWGTLTGLLQSIGLG